jgi:hypothetical protein
MASRLADHLRVARQRRFVGRTAERTLFEQALGAETLPFYLLHVYGPGGIGKSSLLREFATLAAAAQALVFHLDGRNLEPTPEAFLGALYAQDDGQAATVLAETTRRTVLLVDTYEVLVPLDTWLREVFLPGLSEQVLVVIAGREMLASGWRTDPGWSPLLRMVPLRNFSPDESRAFLATRNLPEDQFDAILGFTYGHPLALSLIVDLFDQRPDWRFQPEDAPDMIRTLVERFVQKVPGPAHRVALEACAMVRVINETLLSELLEIPDAHELFEWMRSVSFIESGPDGLQPHELARDALSADIRWRNPDWYAELHNRARRYYNRRLSQTQGREQQRVLSDYMYLHRENPVIKPFIDWQDTGSSVPGPPAEADLPALRAMVLRHEGEVSARLLDYWFARQPGQFLIFRDTTHQPVGFVLMLALEQTTEADRQADPALQATCTHLAHYAPLRPGERATLFRFWMGADDYQAVSAMQSSIFLKMAQHYLTTPDLAYSFFPCAEADFWAPFCAYTELERLPGASYTIDGRSYGVFAHDWRLVPPMRWLDHLASREIATADEPMPAPVVERPLVVLSQEDFATAVWDALRAYARPQHLHDNPLLRARFVQEEAGAEADDVDRVEVLRRLLRSTSELLEANARDAVLHQVLVRTYFSPAPSQEIAADLLHLSFSTYRRYLKSAIAHVTEHLWQREIGIR